MKLNEIFDAAYYDEIQNQIARRKMDDDEVTQDTETPMQDFVISAYEVGQISFEEAEKRIKQISNSAIEKEFWMMELISARELKQDSD